jgi:hypothetical protein
VKEVIQHPDFSKDDLEGFDANRENKKLDNANSNQESRDAGPVPRAPFDDEDFQTVDIGIEVPSGDRQRPAKTFPIPGLRYRPLLSVLKTAFADPIAKHLHFSPFALFNSSAEKEQCIYSEIYNSDAFIAANDDIQNSRVKPLDDPDCKLEKVIAALMFWSDSTHLAQFGTAKLWPIYLFLGNLSQYIRAMPNSGACHHLAYIPSVSHVFQLEFSVVILTWIRTFQLPDLVHAELSQFCAKWGTQKKDILAHCRRELMHGVWKHLLDEEFLHAYKYGIVILCKDGIRRRVFPRIFTYSADYPEKSVLPIVPPSMISTQF